MFVRSTKAFSNRLLLPKRRRHTHGRRISRRRVLWHVRILPVPIKLAPLSGRIRVIRRGDSRSQTLSSLLALPTLAIRHARHVGESGGGGFVGSAASSPDPHGYCEEYY